MKRRKCIRAGSPFNSTSIFLRFFDDCFFRFSYLLFFICGWCDLWHRRGSDYQTSVGAVQAGCLLVVLFYVFSMDTRTAAENSLYVILCSQIASLLYSMVTRSVPEFSGGLFCLMVGGGICGGIFGRFVNRKIPERYVDYLFIGLMLLIMCINVLNIIKYC